MAKKLCILVCSHLRGEVEAALSPEAREQVAVSVFTGCGTFWQVGDELVKLAANCAQEFGSVLVIAGCCSAGLQGIPGSVKLSAASSAARCFDLIAGKTLADWYAGQGAYLVTGGWLAHWRQHIDLWGFDKATARAFFQESTSRLVLIDTGIYPESRDHLREFADFVGLPAEVLPVGLNHFRLFLNGRLQEWRLEEVHETGAAASAHQQAADYMMAFELLSAMTRSRTETEAIRQMHELFTSLFQPDKLVYSPIVDGVTSPPVATSGPVSGGTTMTLLSTLDAPYAWTPSGTGFILRVGEQDDILGFLEVDNFAFPQYKAHYLNLALVLVRVCDMAISNARAYEELQKYRDHLEKMVDLRTAELRQANQVLAQEVLERQRAEEELRTLSRQLFDLQENERRFIARELHDQIGQDLTILNLIIAKLKRTSAPDAAVNLTNAQEIVAAAVSRVRSLSLSLRPGMLDDIGLLATLHWYLPDFSKKTGIQVDFQHYSMDRDFPPDVRTAAYRVIQEALTNVLRYAQTDRATVIARADTTVLTLEVRDEGVGFNPAAVSVSSSGLRGIRERIRPFGGRLAVRSAPGQGTQLTIELPLSPAG